MFSNSVISKSFSIWKTRSAYYINFIIASYFKDLLLEDLKSSKYIVVFSDETLNEKTDILARFFNETTELLETRYFESTFLKIPIALIFYRTLLNLSHLCLIQMYWNFIGCFYCQSRCFKTTTSI